MRKGREKWTTGGGGDHEDGWRRCRRMGMERGGKGRWGRLEKMRKARR